MMNLFRTTPDRSLDRKYLRTCSVYKLLKHGKIGQARALELLEERHGKRSNIAGTLEIWKHGPLKGMKP